MYKVESVIKVKIVYCIRNLSIFICTTYFGEEYKCSDSRRFTKKGVPVRRVVVVVVTISRYFYAQGLCTQI